MGETWLVMYDWNMGKIYLEYDKGKKGFVTAMGEICRMYGELPAKLVEYN